MDTLRKVSFKLETPGTSLGDYEDMPEDEIVELTNERNGYFHVFGNVPFWDAVSGSYRDRIMGIIEEAKTGKVFTVFPENIIFEDIAMLDNGTM